MRTLQKLGVGAGLQGARRADIVAGVTLAAMAIPEALGYSILAGMPPITGLYCMLLPVLVYAVVGSSRQLIIGPDSATAPLVFAAVVPMAALGSARYAEHVATLSLLVGILLLIVFVARLGVLADFLSRPAMMGFLAGIGVTVIISQLPPLLGSTTTADTSRTRLLEVLGELDRTHWPTLVLGLATIAVIVLVERLWPRLPAQLIGVALAVAAVFAFGLEGRGVPLLGDVAGGLPRFAVPSFDPAEWGRLLGPAAAIVVLVIAQTVATGQSFAFRRRYPITPARDILGLGLANVAAAFSGTYCVNGSATKTAVADSAGGRSQVVSLVSVVAVVIVLLVGTGLIARLPDVAVAAVVIVAAARLIDVRGFAGVLRVRPWEFVVALAGALGVVFLSITWGFAIAVGLSIIDRLRIAYRPSDAVIGETSDGGWHDVTKRRGALAPRGLLAYRFSSSLYFPNAGRFRERVIELVDGALTPPRWFVLDASAIADVDYTAGRMLIEVADDLRTRGVTFAIAEVTDELRSLLTRHGLTARIGSEHLYDTMALASEAYATEASSCPWCPPEDDQPA